MIVSDIGLLQEQKNLSLVVLDEPDIANISTNWRLLTYLILQFHICLSTSHKLMKLLSNTWHIIT